MKDLEKNLEVMEMFREGRDKYSSDRFFEAQIEYNQALIKKDVSTGSNRLICIDYGMEI